VSRVPPLISIDCRTNEDRFAPYPDFVRRCRVKLRVFARETLRLMKASADVLVKHRRRSSLALVGGRLVANVRHTPAGGLYVHVLDVGVGKPIYTSGRYEPNESAALLRVLRPGQVVVDVGANIGYFTSLMARRVGMHGRVLAIEPDPGNLALLRANVARNRHHNVEVCPCAVGAIAGTATLYQSRWNKGNHRLAPDTREGHRRTITVPIETLDRLVAQHGVSRIDVVKMDVEGYEPGVFAGMQSTLARDRPVILTEFWPCGIRESGFDPAVFLEHLLRAGYTATTTERPDATLTSVAAVLGTVPDDLPGSFATLVFHAA
jgi:FkbM family methyltransferase